MGVELGCIKTVGSICDRGLSTVPCAWARAMNLGRLAGAQASHTKPTPPALQSALILDAPRRLPGNLLLRPAATATATATAL